ncbi:predicted protein [Plenodomus lingam JN3]|uniref:Uncharacterized protein n=1 Tax=Leptosphaeria maculans (strain JN3 / isolate v23.1.3 / race Av1-4-5-6-7-8) TaxID=985895 RepID=E4ZFY3_LEPMJ|nr:predicted protein [Plenodomus lingam JN3]CBX90203.1 predicted protein [Plenodomus lingam JN3]
MAPLTLLALAMGLHCTVFEYLAPYTCDPFQVAPKMFQQKTVPKPGHASKGRIHTVGRSTYMVRVGTVGTWAGKQDLAQRAAQCSNDAVSRAALRAASRPAALLTDESLRRMSRGRVSVSTGVSGTTRWLTEGWRRLAKAAVECLPAFLELPSAANARPNRFLAAGPCIAPPDADKRATGLGSSNAPSGCPGAPCTASPLGRPASAVTGYFLWCSYISIVLLPYLQPARPSTLIQSHGLPRLHSNWHMPSTIWLVNSDRTEKETITAGWIREVATTILDRQPALVLQPSSRRTATSSSPTGIGYNNMGMESVSHFQLGFHAIYAFNNGKVPELSLEDMDSFPYSPIPQWFRSRASLASAVRGRLCVDQQRPHILPPLVCC